MENKVKYTLGFIALAILLPVRLLMEHQPFPVLSFFLWLASLSVLLFILTAGIAAWVRYNRREGKYEKIMALLVLTGKIASGFSLMITALVFVIAFTGSLFSGYNLSYMLLLPFALFAVLGSYFIRDPEVADWLGKRLGKRLSVIRSWRAALMVRWEKLTVWVLKRKYIAIAAAAVLLLVLLLPAVFKATLLKPKLLRIAVPGETLVINRDFDQRLLVEVLNEDVKNRNVFLEVAQVEGDTLVMGFMGPGSTFEAVRNVQTVYAGDKRMFNLLVHAPEAQQETFRLEVKLYEADSPDGSDARIVDRKTFKVNIRKETPNIDYQLIDETPSSLRKTYRIKNNGSVVSDFSLTPDSLLQNKINIIPAIYRYRLGPGEEIEVSVEPRLFSGFSGVQGTLLGTGGGVADPVTIPVEFNPPERKKLFLAATQCNSERSVLLSESVNRKRMSIAVENPPAYTGPGGSTTGPGAIRIAPPPVINVPGAAAAENAEGEATADKSAGELRNSFGVSVPEPDQVTKAQVLRDVANLRERFQRLKEKFEAPYMQSRIGDALEALNTVVFLINSDGGDELGDETVRNVSEVMEGLNSDFSEFTDFDLINERRNTFVGSLEGDAFSGPVNLRLDAWVGSKDNTGAPAIYIGNERVHFAWHNYTKEKGFGQRVFYGVHNKKIGEKWGPVAMNPKSENGRWPFVIEGNANEVFYTWQGSTGEELPNIYIKTSKDSGKTWSDPLRISKHRKGTFAPRLAYFDATLYLYWTDYNAKSPQLMLVYSKDGGMHFSAPFLVAENVKADGVARMVQGGESVQFVYEKVEKGETYIACQRLSVAELANGRTGSPASNEVFIVKGAQPSVAADTGNGMHLAYVKGENNNSEIFYTHLEEAHPAELREYQLTADSAYSYSPSLSVSKDKIRLLYHSNSPYPEEFIDNLYLTGAGPADTQWGPPVRLPNLSTNGKRVYLSVNFTLPWSRRMYNAQDIRIFLNGWEVGHLENTIPEGRILFPVDPLILNNDPGGTGRNIVTLETTRFNPLHYLAISEVRLISDLQFTEQLVYADSQEEADRLLASKAGYNHTLPDLGIYAASGTKIPVNPETGEDLILNLKVWNTGQGESTASRIEIFGGDRHMQQDGYTGRNLLAQQKIDVLKPGTHTELNLPLTYWPGLEKIVVRVVSKEQDFNPQNNTCIIAFRSLGNDPVPDSLQVEDRSNGVLRMALYEQPGVLAGDVEMDLYRQNSDQKIESTRTNPKIWILPPGRYDVHVRSETGANVAQWIRGIPLGQGASDDGGSVSLDILLQKIDKTLESLNASVTPSEITFQLPDAILFYPGQYEVNPFAEDCIKKIRAVLDAYPDGILKIEAHAGTDGAPEAGLALSGKRVSALKQWLAEREGIAPERLQTPGSGETQPAADNLAAEGRTENGRVSFTLYWNTLK